MSLLLTPNLVLAKLKCDIELNCWCLDRFDGK